VRDSSQRTECAARLLSGVSLVRYQGEEPFFSTERVRLVEDAVLKTVAPGMVSKVQILGAPPVFIRPHGAIAARPALYRQTSEHYRVRVPTFRSLDSSKGEQPAHIRQTVERYHVGRPIYCRSGGRAEYARQFSKGPFRATNSSVAQKQSIRLISGRPRRNTARRDHGCVAERDQRLAEDEESPARYRTQPPLSKASLV
jgi:hypothetical protein